MVVCGKVIAMATARITLTLPEEQIAEIRRRVADHDAASLSGFVGNAVARALQNSAAFSAMIDQSLRESGGPVMAKERAWARKMLSPKNAA